MTICSESVCKGRGDGVLNVPVADNVDTTHNVRIRHAPCAVYNMYDNTVIELNDHGFQESRCYIS